MCPYYQINKVFCSHYFAALAIDVNGETLETVIASATATIGEKITLRRFEIKEAQDGETTQ